MKLEKVLMIAPADLARRLQQDAGERVARALSAALLARERRGLLAGLGAALAKAVAELPALERAEREAAEALAAQQQKIVELEALVPRETLYFSREQEAAAVALRDAKRELMAIQGHAAHTAGEVREKRREADEYRKRIAVLEDMDGPDPDVLAALRGNQGKRS